MLRIGIGTSSRRESVQTSAWLSAQETRYRTCRMRKGQKSLKQMGGASKEAKCASSAEPRAWTREELEQARRWVGKLQRRIAKAQKEKKYNKVKALQHLLVTSKAAKKLAVERVTSNKGKRTAGVDGVTWQTNAAKAQAIGSLKRRGYKPKPHHSQIPISHGESIFNAAKAELNTTFNLSHCPHQHANLILFGVCRLPNQNFVRFKHSLSANDVDVHVGIVFRWWRPS